MPNIVSIATALQTNSIKVNTHKKIKKIVEQVGNFTRHKTYETIRAKKIIRKNDFYKLYLRF